jgi:hypothetical protein
MKVKIHVASVSILIAVMVTLIAHSSAKAQAETSTISTYEQFTALLTPEDFPCLEEDILLDGTLHLVEHTTLNAAGGRNTRFSYNAPNVTAIGDPSGTVYRATGPTHSWLVDDNLTAPPRGRTILDVIHIVGPGDATDLFVWTLFHVTRDASGQITASVSLQRVECRGAE